MKELLKRLNKNMLELSERLQKGNFKHTSIKTLRYSSSNSETRIIIWNGSYYLRNSKGDYYLTPDELLKITRKEILYRKF